ncbi:DUF6115 domain-containing protein [Lysinibacillus sphaericus]
MTEQRAGDIMSTFLIFVSFLLNIICLLAIVILYTRQNRYVDQERRQGKMIEEMEETISAYLIEMKEENEAFIDRLQKRRDSGASGDKSGAGTADAGPASPANKRLNAAKAYKNNSSAGAVDPDQGWTPILPEFTEEETLISQVLHLHEKGLSIEDIAKKLGKGKTEIELLIKFNQMPY